MILSHDQQLYIYQCRRSRAFCMEMEMLSRELSYHKEQLNYPEIDRVQKELNKVKARLERIWDSQVKLIHKIKQENG